MYQYDPPPATYGGKLYAFDNRAHGIDFDLQQFAAAAFFFGDFGRELVEIGVTVLLEQMAGRTTAAGFVPGSGGFAQECLRQVAGKCGFAGVFFAGKQPSVGLVLLGCGDLPPLRLMPVVNHGCFRFSDRHGL